MRYLAALAAIAVLVSACGRPEVGAAPDVEYGRDVCEECGMIIADERFASGYVDDDGDHVFDDIGDLLTHLAAHDRFEEVAPWVHDHAEPTWIRADEAHYVRGTGIRTPMEFGIAAFADPDAAATYAADVGGTTMGWGDLVEDAEAGAISAHDHEAMEDMDDDAKGAHDDDH